MGKQMRLSIVTGILAMFALMGVARATPFTDVVFFGDSLSDTGNVLALTTSAGVTPFPNFAGAPGRFSNGPVWTEYLAGGLGVPGSSDPSRLLFNGSAVVPIGATGGNNYSYGGARTGLGGAAAATTGLLGQVIAWNGSVFGAGGLTRAADPNALYVVFAGANDLRDARAGDAAARAAAAATTAFNLTTTVGLLAQAGARHFLLSNVPDLGKTPEAVGLGLAAASTDITQSFNANLAAALALLDANFLGLTGVDLDMRLLDFFGLANSIYDDATTNGGAVYGITNVTAPCIAPVLPDVYFAPGSTDIKCSVSGYSDPLHPSARVHQLLGQLALNTAIPEPAALGLMLLGLAGMAAMRRRPR